MPNMSYCRFRNTHEDLADCLDALEQGQDLSVEECQAAVQMFKRFLDFCRDMGIINDYDHERVEEYLNELREGSD